MESLYNETIARGYYPMEIESIDGIKVEVYINVRFVVEGDSTGVRPPYRKFILKITKNTLILREDSSQTLEEFGEMIKNIGTLKLNKKTGNFNNEVRETHENLYKFENVVLKYQDCCVCLDTTRTKTPCGHSLCWRCYDQLNKKTCPICRDCLICEESDEE